MSELGFGGEVAELYARFRRGYPPSVVDIVAECFGLTGADLVVDLGCGTGQLAVPISERVGAVIGVDPEPDMLAQARRAAEEHDARNLLWMVGSDRDMPAVGRSWGRAGSQRSRSAKRCTGCSSSRCLACWRVWCVPEGASQ